ncbi:TetR/AcrR family transcriptional regulator [Pseudonocardia acaciae]|uniref:TetR/AcrR family transcriptional regulator n=1 Tax=Pseudonocardia acaciae TaxID=551276 RepID=UPI00048F2943|nr:TetR/AcrR family transcriptional regulator [Pseudonocardia acaciae]
MTTQGVAGRPERTRNRWGEGEQLRTEILNAASRLLCELGDEAGLSIRGVARATGVVPGSIYQHFRNLDELADGLHEHECDRVYQLVERASATVSEDDPVGRLRAGLRAYYDFAVAKPGHYRILFRRHNAGEPVPADPSTTPLGRIVALFVAGFERCEKAGHRLRQPSQQAGTMVFVSTHGLVALYHANPTPRDPAPQWRYVDNLLSLIID